MLAGCTGSGGVAMKTGIQRNARGRIGRTVSLGGTDVRDIPPRRKGESADAAIERVAKHLEAKGATVIRDRDHRVIAMSSKKKPRHVAKVSAANRRAIIRDDVARRAQTKQATQRLVIEVTKSGARSAIVQYVYVDPKTGREHLPTMRQATKRDLARLVPSHLLPISQRPVPKRNPKHGVIGHSCISCLPCWPFGGPGDPDEKDESGGRGRPRRRKASR